MSVIDIRDRYTKEQLITANAVMQEQTREQQEAIADLRNKMHGGILAVTVAEMESEWITTGDPKHPTLWNLRLDGLGFWPEISAEHTTAIRQQAARLIEALANGTRRLVLECYRCGAVKPLCECPCKPHRLSEPNPRCADCAKGMGITDAPDREVWEKR